MSEAQAPSHAGTTANTGMSRIVLAMLVVALMLRVCNLGTFSLWLDEVFQVRLSQGTVADVWHRAAAYEENPPLSAFVMSLSNEIGLSYTAQRLASVTVGVLSILILVAWTRRRFGNRVALISGWLATLSPFHLRYSQELRSYPYFLLFVLLSLLLVDRLIEDGRPVRGIFCGFSLAGGLYCHSLFPLTFAPIAARMMRLEDSAKSRAWIAVPGAAALGILLWAPWIPHLLRAAGTTAEPSAQAWTWRAIARRWQFLTVGGWEGADLGWGGTLLACLALVGVVQASRSWRRGGLEVVTGALVGIVGVELVFHFVLQRWSVGRYSIIGWPFLIVLVALGLELLLRSKVGVLGAVVTFVLVCSHVGGVLEYYDRGRPHWDRMAEVIREERRENEVVLTANIFCQYCVEHYLNPPGGNSESTAAIPVLPIDRDLDRLLDLWPEDRSCLLVRGGTPHSPEVRRIATYFPLIASYSKSQWLYRLSPGSLVTVLPDWDLIVEGRQPGGRWSSPSIVQLPHRLRDSGGAIFAQRVRSWFEPPANQTAFFDFDQESRAMSLVSGWSGFETTPDGVTFVWAAAIEAGVLFTSRGGRATTVRTRLWPLEVPDNPQSLRALVNGRQIGVANLERGRQTFEARVPASAIHSGVNLLVFQFTFARAPATFDQSSRDRRPLACAFDWIEIVGE